MRIAATKRIGTVGRCARAAIAAGVCAALAVTPVAVAHAQVTDADFVLIKPGKFQMGDGDSGAPVHTVTLTHAFLMQKTELTQAQWMAVMHKNPSNNAACGGSCPVEKVNYNDVQSFITELNRLDPGKHYRLPTEAEWEYAARAGTTGEWGVPGPVTKAGWINENSGGHTHPVGQLRPNAWGLYDMEGNVWEWVNDWRAPYSAKSITDPTGPASGAEYRALRGGSWVNPASFAGSAYRVSDFPTTRSSDGGFRLARTP